MIRDMQVPEILQGLSIDLIGQTLIQVLFTFGIPVALAYATTEVKISRDRRKEQALKERDWYQKSSSICQLIIWEFEHLDGDIDVTNRSEGASLNQLGDSEEIKFLDEKFMELLDHASNAPSTIPDEIIGDIRSIVFNYTNPEPTNPPEDITIETVKGNIGGDLEDLQTQCSRGANKKSPSRGLVLDRLRQLRN